MDRGGQWDTRRLTGEDQAHGDRSRPYGPICRNTTTRPEERLMLTRIDHVMICVPDLDRGIDAYTRIGFNIYPGGVHLGRGTHNAIAFHQDDYLELMSVRDPDELRAAGRGGPDAGLLDFLARGGGFRYVIVQSDDLVSDVKAMRQRGADV